MKNLLYKKKIDKFNISLTIHKCPKSMFNEIYPVFKIDINEYFKKLKLNFPSSVKKRPHKINLTQVFPLLGNDDIQKILLFLIIFFLFY